MTNSSPEQIELLLRILADVQPAGIADAAYLFAETESNQESVFVAARDLLERNRVRRLLIAGCTPKSGYLGAAACRAAMVESGIPTEAICEVPMEPTEILHTQIESDATVQFAKVHNYERVLVVAAPFHQERAFLSMVTAALREHPSLKVHSHPGEPQPWDEVVTHSQGRLQGTRAELICEELQRIEAYAAGGDLLPRSAVLRYLRTRDRA